MINRASLRPVVTFLLGCATASIVCVLVKSSHKSSHYAADYFGGAVLTGPLDNRPRRVITDENLNPSQTPTAPCKTHLMILIISDARHKWKRDAQRQSWVSKAEQKYGDFGYSSKTFEYRFVVGRLFDEITPGLLTEAREHKDLVIAAQNDYDSEASTAKTTWAMRWALQHCSFSHILKVEDHTFVNIPLVIGEWLPIMAPSSFYSGLVIDESRVPREAEGNWYMPDENFPDRRYPPFPRLHFAASKDVVQTVADTMNPTFEKVYYDDVGIANVLSSKGISPSNQAKIILNNHKCAQSRPYVVLKVYYAEDMVAFGERMRKSTDHSVC